MFSQFVAKFITRRGDKKWRSRYDQKKLRGMTYHLTILLLLHLHFFITRIRTRSFIIKMLTKDLWLLLQNVKIWDKVFEHNCVCTKYSSNIFDVNIDVPMLIWSWFYINFLNHYVIELFVINARSLLSYITKIQPAIHYFSLSCNNWYNGINKV